MMTPGDAPSAPMMSPITHGVFAVAASSIGVPASATWESANRAVFIPVILRASCVARRVWWANGATTTGGATIEVGIYADAGYLPAAKLVSGSATQGTALEVQFVDVTDTALPSGRYWLAIVSSTTTNTTVMRSPGGLSYDAALRFQETSASPLPTTATPEASSSSAAIYLCGFATTASP